MQPSSIRAAVLAALVLLAAALAVLAVGRAGVAGFVPSLNLGTPPLATVPPAPGAPPPAALSRRVVLVILDGLGATRARQLPALDALRARGVDGTARAEFPTLSRPNYVAMLTGVEPEWSGVRSNDVARAVPLDHLVARLAAGGRRSAYLGDDSPSFPELMPGWDDVRLVPWRDRLAAAALDVLDGDAAFVTYLLSDIDLAGHQRGAASPEYRRAAERYDALLGQLVARLDLSRDTVVVVADHGHTARGGHGGLEPEVVNVPLVLAGAGVRRGAVPAGASLRDLAPTLAALLGVPAPGHARGRALVELLLLPPAAAAALTSADVERRAHLELAAAASRGAIADRAAAVTAARLDRGIGALFALALALAGLVRLRVVLAGPPVLLATLAAIAATALGIAVGFHDFLTTPSVPGAELPVARALAVGAALAVAHVAIAWQVTSRIGEARRRLGAALGIAGLSTLAALAATAAGASLAGVPLAGGFFGPAALVAVPASLSAGGYLAIGAAAVLLVELPVFMSACGGTRTGAAAGSRSGS